MDIKCGRCRVFLPTESFTLRRNGNLNKTCDKCLVFRRNYKRIIKGEGVLESEIPKDTYVGDPIGEKKKCGRCKVDLDISKFAVRRNGTTNSQCVDCINWVREYEGKKKQKVNKDKHKNCDGTIRYLCSYNCKWCYSRSFASSPKAVYWSEKNKTKSRDEFINGGGKFWFNCRACDHEFEMRLYSISTGDHWCPFCSNKKLCSDEDCEACFTKSFASSKRAISWSEKNQTKPRDEFICSDRKFLFECAECDHEFEVSLSHIKGGCWCSFCSNKKLCTDEDCEVCFNKSFAFSDKASEWSVTNKLSARDVHLNCGKNFWFACSVCGHDFETSPRTITCMNSWCPFCANQKLCANEECGMCFNKSFASSKRAPCWSKKNSKVPRDVFRSSGQKYWFTCDKCEYDFEAILSNISAGSWCPKCNLKTQSKLEDHLTKRYPKIIREYQSDWTANPKTTRKFRYDFLLDPYNIFIELDGPQHFRQIGKWTSPEETQKRDRYKERLAVFYGYTIIRLLQEDVLFDRHNWVEKLDSILGLCDTSPKIYHIYSPDSLVQEIEYKTQLIFE